MGDADQARARFRRAFRVIFLLGLLVVMEVGVRVVAGVLGPRLGDLRPTREIYRDQSAAIQRFLDGGPTVREAHDPVLGWQYRAGFHDAENHINSQGLRSDREYALSPAPDVLRVATFGDSFVYCNEVADADAWPALLEAQVPGIEVLNFGVGGYGVDQALLRYERDGAAFAPHVVLMGFAPVDLRRTVNVYRRFIVTAEGPWIKPRFRLTAAGELELLPNPAATLDVYRHYLVDPAAVRALGDHDEWYTPAVYDNPLYDYLATVRLFTQLGTRVYRRYVDPNRLLIGRQYNPRSEAFRIQMALFQRFARSARDRGALPVVVILPGPSSVAAVRAGAEPVFRPLLDALTAVDLSVVDASEAFAAAAGSGVDADWFRPGGHYARAGNLRVAQYLATCVPAWARAREAAEPVATPVPAGDGA